MRRTSLLLPALAISFLAAPAARALVPDVPAGEYPVASWAAREIRLVVGAGLMGPTAPTFRPDDPLTSGELNEAIGRLGRRPAGIVVPDPEDDPDRLVSIRELDARLVSAVGLLPAARAIQDALRAAGLRPPSGTGTETVARLLGLRINHPQGQEHLELGPSQPATRAEAAFSLARLRELGDASLATVRTLAASLRLPAYDEWQRALLDRAVRFVGYPYVWAGSSEQPQQLYYGSAPGGFDCSGFVWRVVKLEPLPGAPALAAVLKGRTTFSMSAEILKARRIAPDRLRAGDLVFFGDRGPQSAPGQIGHMGIYVGGGWLVHSSGNGVTLQPLQGWYAERLAWGRRVLAEAGLAPV